MSQTASRPAARPAAKPARVDAARADTARADTARIDAAPAANDGAPAPRPAPAAADSQQACPIGPVVEIVFSRWTTPILWTLNEHGRQRFVELERRIGTVTPKVLTQRLRQLERDGLVLRTYHAEVPPRVEYEISELGRSLAPLFATLVVWSDANLPKVEQARAQYDGAELRVTTHRG